MGNNYIYLLVPFLVVFSSFSRPLYFSLIYILLYFRRVEIVKGEKYVSSGRKYSQSHLCTIAAKQSLWRSRNKFLGNCLRRGGIVGGEKKSNQVNVAVPFQDTF